MRRLGAAVVAAGILVLAALVLLSPRDEGPAPASDPGPAAPARAPSPPPLAGAPAPSPSAGLCGVVVDGPGRTPVPRAQVALRGPGGTSAIEAGPGGDWCFAGLGAGLYTLAARLGRRSSPPLRDVPVEAGEELRDLVLVLDPGSRVSGRILDAVTGEGIGGARISASVDGLGVGEAVADGVGDYRLAGLHPGPHRLSVEAAGYAAREVDLAVDGRRPLTGVDLHLEREAHVAGRVVDPEGRPVAGALVGASRYRLEAAPEAFGPRTAAHTTRTGPDGTFDLEVMPGLSILTAVAPGFGPGRSEGVEVAPGARREGLELRLTTAASLTLDVLAAGRAPAPGAAVEVVCAGDVLCGEAVTDGAGRAHLDGLAPGAARVRATHAALGDASAEVTLSPGVERRLAIALAGTGEVEGAVRDGRDRPLESVDVALLSEVDGAALGRVRTDPDGRFSARVPMGTPVTVAARDGDGARAERRGVLAGDRVELVLARPGRVTGLVLDAAGRPVPDFTVTAVPARTSGGGRRGYTRRRFVGDSGDFVLDDLPAGAYRLRADAPGHAPGRPVELQVDPGREAGPVRLEVGDAGRIRGRVVDPRGAPLSGARVGIDFQDVRGLARWSGAAGPTSETGADGTFVLDGVPAGDPVRVLAWSPAGYAGAAPPVRVRAGRESGPVLVRTRRPPHHDEAEETFGGVGMALVPAPGGEVAVAQVYEGGPAFFAGLKPGDRLLAVDGRPTAVLGMRGTLDAVRGRVGSLVVLSVRHPESGERFEVRLVRVRLQL